MPNSHLEFFASIFPQNWIITKTSHSLGVDYIIEIIEGEEITGLRFNVMLKIVRSPGEDDQKILLRCKTSTLRYLLKLKEPTMVVAYDSLRDKWHCLWLRNYINYLNTTNPKWEKLENIQIPLEKQLTKNSAVGIVNHLQEFWNNPHTNIPSELKERISPTVFISYSSIDRAFTEILAQRLKERGLGVWFDQWEIKVGDTILRKIVEGIQDNDYLAIIMSPDSVMSPWVQQELNFALIKELENRKVAVLPIYYRDCDIPLVLKPKRYADFRDSFDDGLSDIMRTILPDEMSEFASSATLSPYKAETEIMERVALSEAKLALAYENSKRQMYFLHTREVTLKSGRVQRIYFFARDINEQALQSLPQGFGVGETERTGMPIIKKLI